MEKQPRYRAIPFFIFLTCLLVAAALPVYRSYFSDKTCAKKLNKHFLARSLELGAGYLMRSQLPEGNFQYIYDWQNPDYSEPDSQVRQAGALWGMTLLNQALPSSELQQAILKGFEFYRKHSKTIEQRRFPVYPGSDSGSAGTVALLVLSYVDFLRQPAQNLDSAELQMLRAELDAYLSFLLSLQNQEFAWHSEYQFDQGQPYGKPSPYYDGESLLALVKSAKYAGKTELITRLPTLADAGYKTYVTEALKLDPDSNKTKGYYQWSSMAFYELATSGWENTARFSAPVIELGNWMIDVHQILQKKKNTAYAFEGLIPAYLLSKQFGSADQQKKFRCTIEKGLENLMSWQIGSPIANYFLQKNAPNDSRIKGAVLNAADQSLLRIDVTQHQMHANIMAKQHLYQ